MSLTLAPVVADASRRHSAIAQLRKGRVRLPTFSELADPRRLPEHIVSQLAAIDPDEPRPENLWRVHWFNDRARQGTVSVPGHVVLPSELTGVAAPIVVLFGRRFPMIGAHKVLAAYACLVPRLVTGLFDPTHDKAIWPSTGNYCRGGVAISRILGCRGVAVLPAGMSQERFDWLNRWVLDESDIVRTPGTESNVKEIYDKCAELARDPQNVILNQFSEFANYLIHRLCTGTAFDSVFRHLKGSNGRLNLAAFISATGSAGTIAAGDHLKALHGTRIAAVEAIECPTLLMNGYGEHNIQGIGDKHVPLIHNVMNTDAIIGVSDRASDGLNYLFGSDVGRNYLVKRRRIDADLVRQFEDIGTSGLANIVAAIKYAKHFDLTSNDAVMTVATDGADLYASEREHYGARHYPAGFDEVNAGEIAGCHLDGISDDHLLDLTYVERKRIFNLGYYTWVEQQGVSVADFDQRRDQAFWNAIVETVPAWDQAIREFNAEMGINDD